MGLRSKQGIVKLRWPTQQEIGLEGYFNIFRSSRNDASNIDFSESINSVPIAAWPPEFAHGRVEFGCGKVGEGRSGRGLRQGFPFGHGPVGGGPCGIGSATLEYLDTGVEDGEYGYAVVGYSAAGNGAETAVSSLTATVTVTSPPAAPTKVEATDYDAPTETVTVGWTPDTVNNIVD